MCSVTQQLSQESEPSFEANLSYPFLSGTRNEPSYPCAHPCDAHWTMSPQHAHFSCSQAPHKGSLPVESLGNHFCLSSSQCYVIAFGAEMPGSVPLRRPGLRKLDFGGGVGGGVKISPPHL